MPTIPLLWIFSAKDDLDWARLRWIEDEQAYGQAPQHARNRLMKIGEADAVRRPWSSG